MTCADFRRLWLDREPAVDDATDPVLGGHSAGCEDCRSWVESQRVLDGAFQVALVVAPPPELSARLAQIPALATLPNGAPSALPSWELLVEVALLLVVGLIAMSFGEATSLFGPALARIGGVVQAIQLLLSSPLLGYLQGLVVTMTEALATLLLVGLAILRLGQPPVAASTD